MRIAFLVGSLEAGGLERFVTRISLEARRQKSFEPVVICLNKKKGIFLEDLERSRIEVMETDARWHRSITGILSLNRVIQSAKVDIVHSQVNYSILQQFIATRLARKHFTITERSSYKRTGFSLLRRRIQYSILKACGVQYSANSQPVAKHLAQMLKERTDMFPVIPNGIDSSRTGQVVVESRRAALGIVKDEFVIGYVARMDPPKGHNLFVDVLSILVHEKNHSIKVIFVGDGSLRKHIEDRVTTLKLNSHVIFVGVVRDVENWMPLFDVVALLSNREGMPNVIIEAMAAGKPVIGTAVGNISELLQGGAGLVNDQNDVAGIVASFEKLIANADMRKQMGDVGFNKVQREYALDRTLHVLMSYYNSILRKTE